MSSEKEKEKSKAYLTGNIFHHNHNPESPEETFIRLIQNQNCRIEQIVSSGHSTPSKKPYQQDFNEWVLVMQGEAWLKIESEHFHLVTGDYLLIPANVEHWVTETSENPECIWLTVSFKA
ncbi:MAG: cupin domain-containing protein [Bacteroidales bacterium]|nr:cupin domain-containing protein [Bacteroidales bacterium]